MSKKISELEKCQKINEDSSFPILCNGETKQILYQTLVEDLRKDLNFSEFSGNYEDLENKPQNLVQDENYVHTDNNFTNEEKEKLQILKYNETLTDAIKKATKSGDVTLIASFKEKEDYCTLVLQDSMELIGTYDTKEIDGVVCYRKGSSISLRIKTDYSNPDRPYFSHWEVTGIGKIGMNPEELIFTIHENTVVTAVWSAVEVDKEPVVTMTTGDIIPDKGISNVRVDYEVPDGYSVNQVGIQMSVNDGEMAEKVSKNPSNPNATSGFQGWAGLLMEDQMSEGAIVKLQPYIIFVNDGTESYAYGSIQEFDFSIYKEERESEDEKAIYYSVKGQVLHTSYVAQGEAPKKFYNLGLSGFENEKFEGWIFDNKLYVGSVGDDEFVYEVFDLTECVTIGQLNEAIGNKVDKQTGKSLISNAEIERLAGVENYDDTEIKKKIDTLEENTQNTPNEQMIVLKAQIPMRTSRRRKYHIDR